MATDYLLNIKDTSVMQMVYEQDIDLGFNWQHINSGKQLKDKTFADKSKILGGNNDFFIDGETGEQVPVSGKKRLFPIIGSRPNRLASNQRYSFDGCLDFVEESTNNLQPLKTQEQATSIWQGITNYSELTSMNNPQAERTSFANGAQTVSLSSLNQSFANAQITSPCSTAENRPQDPMNTYNPSNFGSSFVPPTLYNSNTSQPYSSSPRYSTDSYSPSIDTPSNMFTPMMPSENLSPMEGGCHSLTSPNNPEPNFRFDQFNGYNDRINNLPPSSLGRRNPSMTSLPEPGQSFFELGSKPEVPGYYADHAPGLTAPTSFSQNVNSSFLNPPLNNYPPTSLRSSPPSYPLFYMDKSADQQMAPSIPKNGINESCESDSGISLDRSPKGYSYLNTIASEEFISTSRDTSVFHMQDKKPFHQFSNFTNNNTNGMKKVTKKKSNQSTLPRESRDEKRARELNLPFTLEEIILTPVEDYNEMLARTHLNAAQQALIKDIRRRGKNKVAAQNCRKRKIETITNMEEDVDMLRNRRLHLVEEQKQLEMRQHNLSMQYNALYQQVFNSFRDETGRPYDPNHFSLDQVDGSLVIVPRGGLAHELHFGAVQRRNPVIQFDVKMENSL